MDMPSLFDGLAGLDSPNEIYDRIEGNCDGRPRSTSKELWSLRRRTNLSPGNGDIEVLLERSVALLAQRGHMPGWHNQCPVASGIAGSRSDRRSAVDLVHYTVVNGTARLVELKWESDNPSAAISQILRYGVAYILCRANREDLPLQNCRLMDAKHITLEVVAPFRYYDVDQKHTRMSDLMDWLNRFGSEEEDPLDYEMEGIEMAEYLSETSLALDELARSKTEGALTMSLNVLAFPEDFSRIPFKNGQDVWNKCSTRELTEEAQIIRDAFAGLTPVWSD